MKSGPQGRKTRKTPNKKALAGDVASAGLTGNKGSEEALLPTPKLKDPCLSKNLPKLSRHQKNRQAVAVGEGVAVAPTGEGEGGEGEGEGAGVEGAPVSQLLLPQHQPTTTRLTQTTVTLQHGRCGL
jgi:hypothetical protein